MKRIYFLMIVTLLFSLPAYEQGVFKKNFYYAFKSSTWKGNAAPDLFQIKIDKSPLVQSDVFTDLSGNTLSGKFQIIIHPYIYVVAELSKGVVDGTLTMYSYNQEVAQYRMKQGIYEGEQSRNNGAEVYTYKNGLLIAYATYHPNKNLKYKISYKGGKIEGDVIEYDRNGVVVARKTYKDGKLDGELWENRGYIETANYSNDVLNGDYSSTWDNGNLKSKGFYTNGQKDKVWYEYSRDGLLKSEVEYSNGKLNGSRKLYDGANLWRSEAYKDGKLDGQVLVYEKNNGKLELSKEQNYSNGRLDGTTKFYRNGLLQTELNYKDGSISTGKEYDTKTGYLESEDLYKDQSIIAKKIYLNNKLKYLLLEDETGNLQIVREYATSGQTIKKSTKYKKGDNVKLVEDKWGIIDI